MNNDVGNGWEEEKKTNKAKEAALRLQIEGAYIVIYKCEKAVLRWLESGGREIDQK